jgi:hypothetical protein
MDPEAIQKDAPVVASNQPVYHDERPFNGFTAATLEKDKYHLNLLSIFYFIIAGLRAFGAFISLIYLPIGIFILSSGDVNRNGLPPWAGYIFIGLTACMAPFNALVAYLLFHTGRSLRQQKRWKFIFVVAIIDCITGGAVGIVLGIFTIVVLTRESVKELFKRNEGQYLPQENV